MRSVELCRFCRRRLLSSIVAFSNTMPLLGRLLLLVVCVLSFFYPVTGQTAADSDELLNGFDDTSPSGDDDLLEGFDPSDENALDAPVKRPSTAWFKPSGRFKIAASYDFSHKSSAPQKTAQNGLSRLKTEMLLELDVKPAKDWRLFAGGLAGYDFIYGINGRHNYTDEVLEDYESEMELRELYLQGALARHWDIKVGRQIVVWGTSDNIRVVDIINPLDLREPGITDIEDLRLPVTMTKIDYYRGSLNLSGIAVHEVRFDKIPPYGSDFYPYTDPPPEEKLPDADWRNTQLALALTGIFSGWDLAGYWADVYRCASHVEIFSSDSGLILQQKHARIKMAGASSSAAFGNWLVKGEIAWLDGLKFTNMPHRTYRRMDLMAGVEYSGVTNTRMTLEIADRQILDYDDELSKTPDGCREDQLQWVVRLERNFLNDTLNLTFLASMYGERGQDGAFQRFSAQYDIFDAVTVDGGIVLYQSGDLPEFKEIGDNDTLFIEFKYRF